MSQSNQYETRWAWRQGALKQREWSDNAHQNGVGDHGLLHCL
jgi:hypothetical protein